MNSALLHRAAVKYGVETKYRVDNGFIGRYGTLTLDDPFDYYVLTFQDHGKTGEEPLSGTLRTRYAMRRLVVRGIRRKDIVRTGDYSFTARIPVDNSKGAALVALRLIAVVDPNKPYKKPPKKQPTPMQRLKAILAR